MKEKLYVLLTLMASGAALRFSEGIAKKYDIKINEVGNRQLKQDLAKTATKLSIDILDELIK